MHASRIPLPFHKHFIHPLLSCWMKISTQILVQCIISPMTWPTLISQPRNMLVATKLEWVMDQVCILATMFQLLYLHVVVILFSNNFFYFLIFAKTYSRLVNLPLIILCVLSFTLLTFSSRIVKSEPFFIKDHLNDGMHQFFLSSFSSPIKQVLVGERTTPHRHRRLGHPTFRIVHHVWLKFTLSVSPNKSPSSCSACLQSKSHQLPFPSSSSIS